MMMNKKPACRMHLSKYAFIVPAVIIGSFAIGVTRATENIDQPVSHEKSAVKQPIIETIIKSNEQPGLFDKGTKSNMNETPIKQDTSIKKENKKTIVIADSTIAPDDKLSPLIDTLENGALDIRKLGDWGKGTSVIHVRKNPTKGEPMYILDGKAVPYPLLKLKAEDIERIEILKDESATSLYGDDGANGVVIITTKSKTPSEEKTGSDDKKAEK